MSRTLLSWLFVLLTMPIYGLAENPAMIETHVLRLDPGVSAINEATVYLKAGIYRVSLDTSLSFQKDLELIKKYGEEVGNKCKDMDSSGGTYWICTTTKRQMAEAIQKFESTLEQIKKSSENEAALPVRRRRDYNPNALLLTLMKWIIGWSPSSDDA
jgi:hypothetical protein